LISQDNISAPLFGTDPSTSYQNSGSGVQHVTSIPCNINSVSDPGVPPRNPIPASSKIQPAGNKSTHTGTHYESIAKDMGFTLTDSDLTSQQKSQLLQFLGKQRSNFATNPS